MIYIYIYTYIFTCCTFLYSLELLHSYDMVWKGKGEIVLYGNVIWRFKGDMERVDFKHDLAGNIIKFDGGLMGTYLLLWEYSENIIAYH